MNNFSLKKIAARDHKAARDPQLYLSQDQQLTKSQATPPASQETTTPPPPEETLLKQLKRLAKNSTKKKLNTLNDSKVNEHLKFSHYLNENNPFLFSDLDFTV